MSFIDIFLVFYNWRSIVTVIHVQGSKRSVSTEGTGVRIGYGRSTSSERRPTTYAKLVPENQGEYGSYTIMGY